MEVLSATDFYIPPDTMTGGVGDEFDRPQARTKGLHIGEIFRDIENRTTKAGKRTKYGDLRPEERQRMGRYVEVGFIWEVVVEMVWKQRQLQRARRRAVVKQVELVEDNPALPKHQLIYMTPDGWTPEDEIVTVDPLWYGPGCKDGVVLEDKATWRTIRRWEEDPDSNFWEWLERLKCYCRAHRTRRAQLNVLWVNGNYQESGPLSKTYELLFSMREIEEAWAMVTRHRDLMFKEGYGT